MSERLHKKRGSPDPKRHDPDKSDRPAPQTDPPEHPAGPHAAPHLTDHDKTPGTGALPGTPRPGQKDADPGSG